MLSWVCSKHYDFCYGVAQFIRQQAQWPHMKARCFRSGVQRMAEDFSAALENPDVIIVDQRGGWDIDDGLKLCNAMQKRGCEAHIIYLDMTIKEALVEKYLVRVHENDDFCQIVHRTIELARDRWYLRLIDAVEESLEEKLARIRAQSVVQN